MPLMMPLAIDGAAPRMMTNMIADSVSPNIRIASGNHAIDGIVCRPVIIEPTRGAAPAMRDGDAERTPMITDRPNPKTPRCSVR